MHPSGGTILDTDGVGLLERPTPVVRGGRERCVGVIGLNLDLRTVDPAPNAMAAAVEDRYITAYLAICD